MTGAGGHGVEGWSGGGPGQHPLAPVLSLLLALLLAPAAARAGDLSARADVTAARDETRTSESEYLRQVYFVDYRRQVSLPISYRLSVRLQDDRGDLVTDGEADRLRARALAPAASLDYRIDTVAFSLSWRRSAEDTFDPLLGAEVTRIMERLSASAWVRLFEGGEADVLADRLGYSSPTVSTRDDRFGLNFRYGTDRLRLANENRLQHFEDRLTGLTRTSLGPRLTAAWSGAFGETGTFAGQYTVDYFRTEQELKAGQPTLVATEVQPVSSGLWLVDDLPLDTPPMTPVPALVDRVFEVGAGLSLGPADPVFQNVGLDVGRFVPVDELRLHVRGASGAPVPADVDMGWRTYSSQDGQRWAQVDGAASAWNPGLSAWQVTFPEVTARYFKVVSFGRYQVDVVATELQAFLHETFQPNAPRVSSSVRQAVAVNVAGKPLGWLALGLSGQLNADALTGLRGGGPRWSTDLTSQASATCGPFGPWSFDATQSLTRAAQPLGFSQTSLVSAAAARFQPFERLGASLEGRRSEDRLASATTVRTVTHGATASTQLGILETLRASAAAGWSRQDIEGGGSTAYLTGSGQARAQLRRDLELSLEASVQRTLSRQGDTSAQEAFPLLRVLDYQRYTAEVRWHPSQQLDLAARAGWSEAGSRGGVAQSYRAGWQPFPGGAVQLAFDYSEDVDPLSGRSLRRFGAAPRWTINRHASLELSYNLVRGTGDLPVRQQNLYLTFSLKL